jgi:hypothetical protein
MHVRALFSMKTLTKCAVVLVSFSLTALACEGGLRLLGWPSPGLYVNGRGPLHLRQPGRAGGAYPPDSIGRLRHYEYDVGWVTNSRGFREREPTQKGAGEWRIGLLGDSFTAGIGVETGQRFGDLWSESVRRRKPNVTLWNLGSPECGTACEAAILEGADGQYQLDELVLAFYGGNDVQDNVSWYQTSDPAAAQETGGAPSAGKRLKVWLYEHSRLFTFIWFYGARSLSAFRVFGIYSEAELQSQWGYTEKSLARLKGVVGARPLTILYLPATPEWDDSLWLKLKSRYRLKDENRYLIKEALGKWCRQNDVPFVDATPWLRSCPSVGQCTYPVDGHWNARGHRLVADGVSSARGDE